MTFPVSGPTCLEFAAKDSRVNFRVPASLLEAVKRRAAERGIPYQRLIREALEQAAGGCNRDGAGGRCYREGVKRVLRPRNFDGLTA